MDQLSGSKKGLVSELWSFISRKWIQEVPEELAYCEYECREPHCNDEIFRTCKLRLGYLQMLREQGSQGIEQDRVQFSRGLEGSSSVGETPRQD